jgi:protein-tyrosine phosphatase
LADEVEGWETAGLDVVVSLLTAQENSDLGLLDEEAITQRKGLSFISFPIADYSVPSSQESTRNLVVTLDELLLSGRKIGIHCRQVLVDHRLSQSVFWHLRV